MSALFQKSLALQSFGLITGWKSQGVMVSLKALLDYAHLRLRLGGVINQLGCLRLLSTR